MELCPQCKHPRHLPIKDDGTEGCPIIVYLEPLKKDKGYYHEHCDCDYKETKVEERQD